jgi:hypothetical protein
MTPSYRSSSTAAVASPPQTSLTITKPAGTADGDYLLFCLICIGGGFPITVTTLAGWTLLNSANNNANEANATYYKLASGEGASYTWAFNTNPGYAIGYMAAFSSAAGISDSASRVGGSNSLLVCPSVNALTSADMLVCFAAQVNVSGSTITGPAGMTDVGYYRDTPNAEIIDLAYIQLAVAGATGTKTATASIVAEDLEFSIALTGTPIKNTLLLGSL